MLFRTGRGQNARAGPVNVGACRLLATSRCRKSASCCLHRQTTQYSGLTFVTILLHAIVVGDAPPERVERYVNRQTHIGIDI